MRRHTLLLLPALALAAALACQTESTPPPEPEAAGERSPEPTVEPAAQAAGEATDADELAAAAPWEAPGEDWVVEGVFEDFAANAFPPTLPPTEFHENAWYRGDCMDCHGFGRDGAPVVRHEGMTTRLLQALCRTCHVMEPRGEFAYNAFPPTLPDDNFHANSWLRSDCLLCHETGVRDAPRVRHTGMSRALLRANCRTCHVVTPPEVPR